MTRISLSDQILNQDAGDFVRRKKPDWLRAKLPSGPGYKATRELLKKHNLHTVCESAMCPNMGECWERGTATMMILGDVCTRACGFCHIKTGRPPAVDLDEPRRVGEAAAIMRLKHIVLTSVNRDELPDGGAEIWAETIRQIRRRSPGTNIEVLIPDFEGDWDALQLVLDERPEILNHNLETVPRMYSVVRPQAIYERSLELLRRAKAQGLNTKTGIMVGIGEADDELLSLMDDVQRLTRVDGVNSDVPETSVDIFDTPDPDRDLSWREALRDASATGGARVRLGNFDLIPGQTPEWSHTKPQPAPGMGKHIESISYPNKTYPGVHPSCDILTIGQYLQPTKRHLPITRWVEPDKFVWLKQEAEARGFRHCESGALVRSSYHADDQVLQMESAGSA